MKKALIIHGWDGNPNEPLHRYLKGELEKLGYEVTVPKMPNPEAPVIKDWINEIDKISGASNDVIIGHSVGCQAILRYIETLKPDIEIPRIVLIAPWMKLDENTIKEEGEEIAEIAKPWMKTPIDFEKVKKRANKFVAIFSDNDPYVPLDQADLFREKLNAEIFIENNQGHFTESDNFQSLQTDTNLIFNYPSSNHSTRSYASVHDKASPTDPCKL